MIRLKHLEYSQVNLTRVFMPAGTRYRIPAAENDRSIGVVCVRGGTRHAVDGPTVSLPQEADGLVLNDTAAGWSNDAVGHTDLHLYAPVDTEWVCIGENGCGRPGLELVPVAGASRLAAGLGVIVVDGAIVVDGVAGGPDAAFKPRQTDVVMSGAGRAILVRFQPG